MDDSTQWKHVSLVLPVVLSEPSFWFRPWVTWTWLTIISILTHDSFDVVLKKFPVFKRTLNKLWWVLPYMTERRVPPDVRIRTRSTHRVECSLWESCGEDRREIDAVCWEEVWWTSHKFLFYFYVHWYLPDVIRPLNSCVLFRNEWLQTPICR